MAAGYTISLDVSRWRVVIVGGGPVARRKAAGLIDAGATDVTVVSPTLVSPFPPVKFIEEKYTPAVLIGARLVFAATNDPAVNAAVVSDARAVGAIVSRADVDEAAAGDFTTPAKFDAGPVTVTVSTGSAALTAAVRDGLRARFDPRWSAMAEAMATLRPTLRDRVPAAERPAIFRRLATDEAFDVLQSHGIDGLLAWALVPSPDTPLVPSPGNPGEG